MLNVDYLLYICSEFQVLRSVGVRYKDLNLEKEQL